ncbi:MAG: DUF4270 domain-containing protein [Flavobacteriales bacterium]|nr:DUF4270 domain-containing protein [Flavobacteriales bacterium]
MTVLERSSARPAKWVALLFGVVLISGSCRKPEEDLGLDLLPSDPLGLVLDTTALHAFTFRDTAVRTSGLTRNLVGSYLDQEFGKVRTGIVTQLRLSSNNVGAGQDNSGLQVDSLVLSLAFDGINYVYGSLQPQTFSVHELVEPLSVDSAYYTDDIPAVLPAELSIVHGSITPEPLRNPVIGGDSLLPQVRIRLDDALGQRFLMAFGTQDMTDNTAFLEYFKGLYVSVENGEQLPFQQGILYFSLLNGATKATLYYKDANDEPELQRSFDLLVNSNCVRYTVAEHDHAQAITPGLPAALGDTVSAAQRTYVQTLGGLRTAIRFPHLMDHATTGQVLAKAELVVPLDGTFNADLPPPGQLFIFRKDSIGRDVFLPDQLGGIGAIDGLYRPTDREYRFNITRYVQGVLSGNIENSGVELVSGSNGVTANRAILAGPARAEDPMRLELTFTTY